MRLKLGLRIKAGLLGLVVMALAVVGLTPSGRGGGIDFSRLLDQITPAVVQVSGLLDPEEDLWSSATGYLVSPDGKVLTACSAVIDALEVRVTLNDGTVYGAAVERCDEEDIEAKMYNVALLQLDLEEQTGVHLPRLWLSREPVQLWENIFLLSHPAPYGELTVTEGMVSGRLPRPYLTLGERVFGIWLLVQVKVAWATPEEGALTGVGSIVDLDYSDLSLAQLADYVRESQSGGWEVILLGVEEPREDVLFCGLAVSAAGEGAAQGTLEVERINCFWLLAFDGVVRTGEVGQLDRELLFYKISAAAPSMREGSAGSPVVNLSGQVVGMLSWTRGVEIATDERGELEEIRAWPGAHYIIPVEALRQFLDY